MKRGERRKGPRTRWREERRARQRRGRRGALGQSGEQKPDCLESGRRGTADDFTLELPLILVLQATSRARALLAAKQLQGCQIRRLDSWRRGPHR